LAAPFFFLLLDLEFKETQVKKNQIGLFCTNKRSSV